MSTTRSSFVSSDPAPATRGPSADPHRGVGHRSRDLPARRRPFGAPPEDRLGGEAGREGEPLAPPARAASSGRGAGAGRDGRARRGLSLRLVRRAVARRREPAARRLARPAPADGRPRRVRARAPAHRHRGRAHREARSARRTARSGRRVHARPRRGAAGRGRRGRTPRGMGRRHVRAAVGRPAAVGPRRPVGRQPARSRRPAQRCHRLGRAHRRRPGGRADGGVEPLRRRDPRWCTGTRSASWTTRCGCEVPPWAASAAIQALPYYRDTNPDIVARSWRAVREVLADFEPPDLAWTVFSFRSPGSRRSRRWTS